MKGPAHKRFAEVREDAGLTQEALAERWGFSKSQISAVERGFRAPGPELRELIEDFTEVYGTPVRIRDWPRKKGVHRVDDARV